jgi:hypothetical protein
MVIALIALGWLSCGVLAFALLAKLEEEKE